MDERQAQAIENHGEDWDEGRGLCIRWRLTGPVGTRWKWENGRVYLVKPEVRTLIERIP